MLFSIGLCYNYIVSYVALQQVSNLNVRKKLLHRNAIFKIKFHSTAILKTLPPYLWISKLIPRVIIR